MTGASAPVTPFHGELALRGLAMADASPEIYIVETRSKRHHNLAALRFSKSDGPVGLLDEEGVCAFVFWSREGHSLSLSH